MNLAASERDTLHCKVTVCTRDDGQISGGPRLESFYIPLQMKPESVE